jgi:CO/xanthine dehydrogenase FAD-binding subunit
VGGRFVTESYIAAESVEGALAALASGARPVAGGTDLVVGARQGKAPLPDSIVAIHRLAELHGVALDGGALRLGALTTHEEIAENTLVLERLTALADAAAIVGSHATRAQGTVGGNLMNASPAMEIGGPLMCFGAAVTLRSQGGERSVAVADLFAGPGKTIAEPDELLTEVAVPLPPEATGSCYARLEYRQQMEIAVVGATAIVTLAGDRVTAAKLAITALAPTVRLVPAAEEALVGSDGGRAAAELAAQAAAKASEPISDVRASEAYRRAMTAVLTRRAIEAAVARARGISVPVPASRFLHAAG